MMKKTTSRMLKTLPVLLGAATLIAPVLVGCGPRRPPPVVPYHSPAPPPGHHPLPGPESPAQGAEHPGYTGCLSCHKGVRPKGAPAAHPGLSACGLCHRHPPTPDYKAAPAPVQHPDYTACAACHMKPGR